MSHAKTHKLLCIVCPKGCEMDITESDGILKFPKGICVRGQAYAKQEIYNPCRVLTTTVELQGSDVAMLPVRTEAPIVKGKLVEAMNQIARLKVSVPVRRGDVVCENVAGTGIKLIASRTLVN
jgi:CxxC motif-containing protein